MTVTRGGTPLARVTGPSGFGRIRLIERVLLHERHVCLDHRPVVTGIPFRRARLYCRRLGRTKHAKLARAEGEAAADHDHRFCLDADCEPNALDGQSVPVEPANALAASEGVLAGSRRSVGQLQTDAPPTVARSPSWHARYSSQLERFALTKGFRSPTRTRSSARTRARYSDSATTPQRPRRPRCSPARRPRETEPRTC